MTGAGRPAKSALARLGERQELRLAAALWRADRPLAAGWWGLLAARGVLPACFAVAAGVLVGAVERGSGLAVPLTAVAWCSRAAVPHPGRGLPVRGLGETTHPFG